MASESVEKCDIFVYNRNNKEVWVTKEFCGHVGADGYVTIEGVKFGPFGAGGEISFTYQAGDCTESNGNCCLKSHINRVRLL